MPVDHIPIQVRMQIAVKENNIKPSGIWKQSDSTVGQVLPCLCQSNQIPSVVVARAHQELFLDSEPRVTLLTVAQNKQEKKVYLSTVI